MSLWNLLKESSCGELLSLLHSGSPIERRALPPEQKGRSPLKIVILKTDSYTPSMLR